MRDELIFPISEQDLPDTLHENLRLKAEREEKAKIEAELKARRVSVRYLVGDANGVYLSKIGALNGREGPVDKVEMDQDVTGLELGARLAEGAGVKLDEIEDLWLYPDYFWPSSAYYAPKKVESSATASELAKGWVFICLKETQPAATEGQGEVHKDEAQETDDVTPPPMVKETTEEGDSPNDHSAEVSGLGSSESTEQVGHMNILGLPDEPAPLARPKKTETATAYSNLPALIPLCVYRRGALEYVGICKSALDVFNVLSSLEPSLVDEEQRVEMIGNKRERTRPIRATRYGYNDGLYGDDENKEASRVDEKEEDVVLEFEDKFSFCVVEKNELKNIRLRNVHGGSVLVAFASTVETQKVSIAYDKLCNSLSVTVYQLDDALTPEELCEIIVCPSYTYDQLQECVYEAMTGASGVPLLNHVRRMPKTKDQIGFRCHDDRTDRPHKTMMLSNKNKYGDKNTAQSILSNKGTIMITKLYIEVLPDVISISELDDHGSVCDIPLHLGYFYHRHFYMKEARFVPLYEVYRVCMAQQLSSLPDEFKERVEKRWIASRDAFLENRKQLAEDPSVDQICKLSTFDPVFRLVRMSYNGLSVHSEYYDWEEAVSLDPYYDYVVDLLPADITKVNWTKYVTITPQIKPQKTVSQTVASPDVTISPLLSPDTQDSNSEEKASSLAPDVEEVVVKETTEEEDDSPKQPPLPQEGAPEKEMQSVEASQVPGTEGETKSVEAKPEDGDEASTCVVKLEEATNEKEDSNGEDKVKTEPDDDNAAPAQPLLIEDRKHTRESSSDTAMGIPSVSFPEESSLGWYQLFHGDRRYTDAIYGLVSTVVLPVDTSLTGSELMDIILRQIGVLPGEEAQDETSANGSPTGVSSPSSSACPKMGDAYLNAKKTWKLVFKGKQTKVLEPNTPYEKIEKDVGKVDYIMLDHPQSTKARVLSRYQRAEQAIRIGIIASETEKMKQKHAEGAKVGN